MEVEIVIRWLVRATRAISEPDDGMNGQGWTGKDKARQDKIVGCLNVEQNGPHKIST